MRLAKNGARSVRYFFERQTFYATRNETMADVEAYCVKCKAKKIMNDPQEVDMKGGRRAMQGKCPVCGTKMFRIMGKK